jgi:hypothetical protein
MECEVYTFSANFKIKILHLAMKPTGIWILANKMASPLDEL